MKVKVNTEITITVGKQSITLNRQDAEELYDQLGDALGYEPEVEPHIITMPALPANPPWDITFDGTGDGTCNDLSNYFAQASCTNAKAPFTYTTDKVYLDENNTTPYGLAGSSAFPTVQLGEDPTKTFGKLEFYTPSKRKTEEQLD